MHFAKTRRYKVSFHDFICLLSLFFCQQINAEQIKAEKVTSWDDGEQISLYCAVVVPFKHQISSYTNAELSWILPEGSLVQAGDLLARQDNFHLSREIKMLDIRIADAQSKVEFTDKEYIRLQRLSKEHVSESQLNGAKRKYEQAKYGAAEMEQQREVINYHITRLEHHASSSGRVAHLTANVGENIVIGQPIMQLISTQSKELACSIPLGAYQQFKIYKNEDLSTIQFLLDGKHLLVFKRHQAIANKVEQTITVFLSLPTVLQKILVIGKRLQVAMNQDTENMIKIPFDALIIGSDGNYVWALDEDNTVHKQYVDIISAHKVSFVVRSTLKVGTRVVVRGKQSMEPGKEVSLVGYLR